MPRRLWTAAHPPLDGSFSVNRASAQAVGLKGWIPDACRSNPLGHGAVVLNSSVTVVSDPRLGQVYSMSAGHVEVTIERPAVNMQTAGWSMGTWINYASTTGSQVAICVALVGSSNTATSFGLQNGAGSNMRVQVPGAGLILGANLSPTIGIWYRVWFVWNGTAGKIYVNGQDDTGTAGTTPVSFVPDTLTLGRYHDAGYGGDALNGKVLDGRYYNRALTPAEIWADYEPSTRYDLWLPLRRQRSFVSAAAGVVGEQTIVRQAINRAANY